MKLATSRRKHPNACPRFVTTSVVSDGSLLYQKGTAMDSPEKCSEFWSSCIAIQPDHEPDKESVVVVLLNTRLIPYGWNRVSLGTVNESNAHPREVLRPVIAGAAYGFVLMHNHPSGDPSPSRSDEQTTRRMIEAASLMQIRFIDHVITGKKEPGRSPYYSFREAGIIP
ncbi:MAG: JAB domain-containing protein [Verrucomicrobiota bacterium]